MLRDIAKIAINLCMYIRCKKFSNSSRRVLAIYHSFRNGKKVSQKLLKYIGTAHTEEQYAVLLETANKELKALISKQQNASKPPSVDLCDSPYLSDVVEEQRIIEGFHEVCGKVLDRIQLKDYLTSYRYDQLKNVIVSRIAYPTSKRHTAQLLRTDYGIHITENRIYRLMDELLLQENCINNKIFEYSKLLNEKQMIDLLLFDVTTLYFESQKNDEIRDFGYSKDHKVGEVQVVLALATTSSGLPLGYHVFSGKTAETNTLLECLAEWKKLFTIDNTIVVADRAMMSDRNLLAMEEAGIRYVVAAKLKTLPRQLQKEILKRHQEIAIELFGEHFCVQEQKYNDRRLVIGFNESRAIKDKADRERLIFKLRNKLSQGDSTKKLVTNRGYLKFTDEKLKGQVEINEDRVLQDAQWDGLHGIITNDKESTPEQLLCYYRRLWIIEESFRINKHTLSMRPIYHFTPRRIKAHILLCYIAFAVSRYLQHHVRTFDYSMSIERIREALFSVQSSIVKHTSTDIFYRIPSKLSQDAKVIYKSFSISRKRHPSKISKPAKCSATKKMQVIDS